jgi:hypothetical protein
MDIEKRDLESIWLDVHESSELSDYEAVEVLWVALIKISNLFEGNSEHKRIINLIGKLPFKAYSSILNTPEVDELLHIQPPLETILTNPHERLNKEEVQKVIEFIKNRRDSEAYESIIKLGDILKKIRNKRAHGFKTRNGPRDKEILGAARAILKKICEISLEYL